MKLFRQEVPPVCILKVYNDMEKLLEACGEERMVSRLHLRTGCSTD